MYEKIPIQRNQVCKYTLATLDGSWLNPSDERSDNMVLVSRIPSQSVAIYGVASVLASTFEYAMFQKIPILQVLVDGTILA